MNIDKLEVGQSFKNYKEMCSELEMEVKKSVDTKNAQFKELSRYCKYSKVGHRITILDKYETPLPKIDNRGKSEGTRKAKSVYGDMIQLLILDLLAQCKHGRISISRSKLMLSVSMINSNYSACGEQTKKLSKYTNIDEAVIYDFYNTSKSNFKSTVETALSNLMDKRIIWYDTVTKIRELGGHEHRLATDDEKEIILEVEKSILEELGYEKISEVRISKHWRLFKRKVKFLLHSKSEIDFYYSAYNINANEKYLEEERDGLISYLLEDAERKEFKGELNSTICENLSKSAHKRHEKGFLSSGKIFRMDENYTNSINELIGLLIKSSTPNVIKQVQDTEIEDELTEEQMELLRDLFV